MKLALLAVRNRFVKQSSPMSAESLPERMHFPSFLFNYAFFNLRRVSKDKQKGS